MGKGTGEPTVEIGRPTTSGEPRPPGRELAVAMGSSHFPPAAAAEEQPKVRCEVVGVGAVPGQWKELSPAPVQKDGKVVAAHADHKGKKGALKKSVHDSKAPVAATKPKPSPQEKQGKAKPGARDDLGKGDGQTKTKPSVQGEQLKSTPQLMDDPSKATATPPEDHSKATPTPSSDPAKATSGAQDKEEELGVQSSALKRELMKVEKAGTKARSPVARGRIKVEIQEQSFQEESRGNSDQEDGDGYEEGEEEEEEPTQGARLARTPCLRKLLTPAPFMN